MDDEGPNDATAQRLEMGISDCELRIGKLQQFAIRNPHFKSLGGKAGPEDDSKVRRPARLCS
jgi:hypothetical protein